MDILKGKWEIGELVTLPRHHETIKESGSKTYSYLTQSRYICIREAVGGRKGILLKYLGRTTSDDILLINGAPFFKDGKTKHKDKAETSYYSFEFPTLQELKEALSIIWNDKIVETKIQEVWEHFNCNSTFWIRELKSQFFGLRVQPQYFDAKTDELKGGKNNGKRCQRVSILYFE